MAIQTSYAHKVMIEILVFMAIVFTVETVFFGTASMVGWEIKPYFQGIIILEQIAWFAQAVLWFGTLFVNMVTFNIPGLPAEILAILAPGFAILIVIELIVFWRDIEEIVRTVWTFAKDFASLVNPFHWIFNG